MSQSHGLEHIDLELKKTLCTQWHIASRAKIKDKIEMDLKQQPQAP